MNIGFWHVLENGRIQCDLCPRFCQLAEGQRGLCFVRARENHGMVLTTYGKSSGFCIDPIEKKPLNHFLPGTPTLSFGTAGCNLTCKFCQNWDISKSRQMDRLSELASPQAIAEAAHRTQCRSVAYTYNDPIIFWEYARDVALACREKNIKSVAVTAGYINLEPAAQMFAHMDAANVDLKSFSEDFYVKLTGGHLQPVLELLEYLKHQTSVWIELTTLLIPGENDSDAELDALTHWVVDRLGPEVPMHFSAFHPAWKFNHKPPTAMTTLLRACQIAQNNGLRYTYAGNVQDRQWGSTFCHVCDRLLIERHGYTLGQWHIDAQGRCPYCATLCAGVFESTPGGWGAKRQPLHIGQSE